MSNAEIIQSSTHLLEEAKARIERIERIVLPAVFRHLLPVADKLVQAKEAYERETGTGHGKRNPEGHLPFRVVAARALERSESFVERLVQLSRLDPSTRELAAENAKLVDNQGALLALAREPSLERRRLAVEAFATGGRAALGRVLDALVEPVDVESVDAEAVTAFLTDYTGAKAAAIEARKTARELREPKALEKRRANARVVFNYLSSGECKIDDTSREQMGISRAACKRALDDLRASNIIQGSGYLGDTFEVFDGSDLTHLVLDDHKRSIVVVLKPCEPVIRKVSGDNYEFTVVLDGTTAQLTMRPVKRAS